MERGTTSLFESTQNTPSIGKRMEEKYERIERIGEGAYGVVFKGRNRETGKFVALKKIRFDNEEGMPATALREVTVLKKLKGANIVALDDVVHEDNKLFLVFEFLNQDLKVYIDSIGPEGMDPRILNSFARQMLRGLAECHSRLVIHRDLKPQNLLIDAHGNLKLADFGLARAFKTPIHKYTHEVVTLWYRAPEILLGSDHYSTGVDLWAAGCIIAEMSNLASLFPGNSEIDQLFQVFRVLGTPVEETWPGVSLFPDYSPEFPKWRPRNFASVLPHMNEAGVELIRSLLTYIPSKRLTAKEAIDHTFFSSMEFEEHFE
jgi:cyclin-dependent kinase 2